MEDENEGLKKEKEQLLNELTTVKEKHFDAGEFDNQQKTDTPVFEVRFEMKLTN